MPCRRLGSATVGVLVAALGCGGSPPMFPGGDGTSTDAGPDASATSTPTADDGESTDVPTDTTSGGTVEVSASTGSSGDASDTTSGVATDGASETGAIDCTAPQTIEVSAPEAVLSGDWTLVRSMFGEGLVAASGRVGTAVFAAELPCAATWHVWVRMRDAGNDDSLHVQVDGIPRMAEDAIFEIDCTAAPNVATYTWGELNYREPTAGACEYLYDPWTFDTGPGPIEVAFSPREPGAVVRVFFTTDPMFEPPPPP